jgi:hypothetical protein
VCKRVWQPEKKSLSEPARTGAFVQQHRRRIRAADVPRQQRHGSRAAAAASKVYVKPLPFTGRTDFPPPPVSTVFGW